MIDILMKLKQLKVIRSDRLFREWEISQLRQLFEYLDVDCVFDAGANVGQYAHMLRRKVGFKGRIISFEPLPNAYEELRRISVGDPLWEIEMVAVSSTTGSQTFNIMNESQFSSLADPSNKDTDEFRFLNAVRESVQVQTETLSSLFTRLQDEFTFSRPFLKMDTQGFDVEIAKASPEAMRKFVAI